MTKMQVVAKTILTVLGIHAIVALCGNYPGQYLFATQEISVLSEALFFLAFILGVAFVGYFMVFGNNQLSRKMAGTAEQFVPRDQTDWLVKSLRVGLVFAGLMLLPRSVPILIRTAKLFFLIRPAVSDIIVSKTVPDILRLSYAQWYRTIYEFLKAILAIYLLCGAPYFLRWQMRHSSRTEAATKKTEIADPGATN